MEIIGRAAELGALAASWDRAQRGQPELAVAQSCRRGPTTVRWSRLRGRILDPMTVKVEVVREATEELVAAFGRLLPQLSRSAPPLDRDALARIIAHDANTVLVARAGNDAVVGALTLVMVPVPSGVRARIEDVVVDAAARGAGIGSALTQAAIAAAKAAGARTLDLTSRPDRDAAARLYERLGFRQRDSRLYRLAD